MRDHRMHMDEERLRRVLEFLSQIHPAFDIHAAGIKSSHLKIWVLHFFDEEDVIDAVDQSFEDFIGKKGMVTRQDFADLGK
jgi:hypothetical protein